MAARPAAAGPASALRLHAVATGRLRLSAPLPLRLRRQADAAQGRAVGAQHHRRDRASRAASVVVAAAGAAHAGGRRSFGGAELGNGRLPGRPSGPRLACPDHAVGGRLCGHLGSRYGAARGGADDRHAYGDAGLLGPRRPHRRPRRRPCGGRLQDRSPDAVTGRRALLDGARSICAGYHLDVSTRLPPRRAAPSPEWRRGAG